MHLKINPCVTRHPQLHSSQLSEAFALSSHGNHVADFYVGPQLLQFIQPEHLLMWKTIIGAFNFHQLECKCLKS